MQIKALHHPVLSCFLHSFMRSIRGVFINTGLATHCGSDVLPKKQREIHLKNWDSLSKNCVTRTAHGKSGQQIETAVKVSPGKAFRHCQESSAYQWLGARELREHTEMRASGETLPTLLPDLWGVCRLELCEVVRGCLAVQPLAPALLKCDTTGFQRRFLPAGLQIQISCYCVYTTREQTTQRS